MRVNMTILIDPREVAELRRLADWLRGWQAARSGTMVPGDSTFFYTVEQLESAAREAERKAEEKASRRR